MAESFPQIASEGLNRMVIRFAPRMDLAANRAARAFRAVLEAEGWPGIEETSVALVTVLVRFDPVALPHAALTARLRERLAQGGFASPPATRLWRIPTVYGGDHGPDLTAAAALAGVSPEAAVAELSAAMVEVLAIGFAPGQPYLGELPAHWALPRRETLNPQVPEGALTTAIRQFVLFANPSPTGWWHIGQTAFRCFRPEDADPFPLAPGDRVRFEAVSAEALARLRAQDPSGGGAVLEAAP